MMGVNLLNESQLDCDFRRWRLELEKVAGGDLPRKGHTGCLSRPSAASCADYHPDLTTSHLSSWSINRETQVCLYWAGGVEGYIHVRENET